MTVRVEMCDAQANVFVDRLGLVGVVKWSPNWRRYRFVYLAKWERLTYDENTAVQEAVKKPVLILDATARLKGKP